MRHRKVRLLEIGVGGEQDPHSGGHSLRMWKRYFPRGEIVGIDLFDKSPQKEARISVYQVDQSSPQNLLTFAQIHGPFDIVIDDGSHICSHVVTSFKSLYDHVSEHGIYVVEDTQTSYWPAYGGSSVDLNAGGSSLPFFKNLTDYVNHQEIIEPPDDLVELGRKICSIAFHHNLVVIRKGPNAEPGMDGRTFIPPPQGTVRSNDSTPESA